MVASEETARARTLPSSHGSALPWPRRRIYVFGFLVDEEGQQRTSLRRANETCEKPDKTLSTCVLMLTPTEPEPPQLNGTSQAGGPGLYFRLCHIICKFSIPSKRSPVHPSLSWLNGKQKFTDNLGTSFLPSCFSLLPLRWSTEGLM